MASSAAALAPTATVAAAPSASPPPAHHHRSAGVFMSDGGGAGGGASSAAAHHHHSVSSPSVAHMMGAGRVHPAGLPSTDFQNPLIGPTLGKSSYEGRRVHQVLTRGKKAPQQSSPSPGDSPQKAPLSHRKASMRAARMSSLEAGLISPIARRTKHAERSPSQGWASASLRKNSMPLFHASKTLVVGSPSRAATAPEQGMNVFPNFIQIHGQVQELLSAAYELNLLSKDMWAELDHKTANMFHTYDRLVMEMQRPVHHQAKADRDAQPEPDALLQALVQAQAQARARLLDNKDAENPSTQATADLLVAASHHIDPRTPSKSPPSSLLDLNMQSPLPDTLFYSAAVACTMPSPQLNAHHPAPVPPRQQTLRKSFKLSEMALESVNDAMVEVAPSPQTLHHRVRQARIEHLTPERAADSSCVQLVTSMALENNNETLSPGEELRVDRRPAPRRARDASYIVQSKVSNGDVLAGSKYNWEARDFDQLPMELCTERRQSFQVSEHAPGARVDEDLVRIEYPGGADENYPAHMFARTDSRGGKPMKGAKTIQTMEMSQLRRTSLSFSTHSTSTMDVWHVEDHSSRGVLAPLQIQLINNNTHGHGSRPLTPRSAKSPLTPRRNSVLQSMSPRGSLVGLGLGLGPLGLGPGANNSSPAKHALSPTTGAPRPLGLNSSPLRLQQQSSPPIRRARHNRSQTLSSLTTLPELLASLPECQAKLPPFERITDEDTDKSSPSSSTQVERSKSVADVASHVAPVAPVPSVEQDDPHLAALRRQQQRETVNSLRAQILHLEATKRELESDLASSRYTQADLMTYVTHMRLRFMQRAFLVVKYHDGWKGAASLQSEKAKRYFALSIDGTHLWWSKHPSMDRASSLAIIGIDDVRVSLLGVATEFGLAELMDEAADSRVTYDPEADAFEYPPTLSTHALFQMRRELYNRVLGHGHGASEGSEAASVDLQSTPSTDFFPSPLRAFHAASWRVSFTSASAHRALDLLFQTKGDLDVWIEFMQRVWQMKHRKRLEEQAAGWREERKKRDSHDTLRPTTQPQPHQ